MAILKPKLMEVNNNSYERHSHQNLDTLLSSEHDVVEKKQSKISPKKNWEITESDMESLDSKFDIMSLFIDGSQSTSSDDKEDLIEKIFFILNVLFDSDSEVYNKAMSCFSTKLKHFLSNSYSKNVLFDDCICLDNNKSWLSILQGNLQIANLFGIKPKGTLFPVITDLNTASMNTNICVIYFELCFVKHCLDKAYAFAKKGRSNKVVCEIFGNKAKPNKINLALDLLIVSKRLETIQKAFDQLTMIENKPKTSLSKSLHKYESRFLNNNHHTKSESINTDSSISKESCVMDLLSSVSSELSRSFEYTIEECNCSVCCTPSSTYLLGDGSDYGVEMSKTLSYSKTNNDSILSSLKGNPSSKTSSMDDRPLNKLNKFNLLHKYHSNLFKRQEGNMLSETITKESLDEDEIFLLYEDIYYSDKKQLEKKSRKNCLEIKDTRLNKGSVDCKDFVKIIPSNKNDFDCKMQLVAAQEYKVDISAEVIGDLVTQLVTIENIESFKCNNLKKIPASKNDSDSKTVQDLTFDNLADGDLVTQLVKSAKSLSFISDNINKFPDLEELFAFQDVTVYNISEVIGDFLIEQVKSEKSASTKSNKIKNDLICKNYLDIKVQLLAVQDSTADVLAEVIRDFVTQQVKNENLRFLNSIMRKPCGKKNLDAKIQLLSAFQDITVDIFTDVIRDFVTTENSEDSKYNNNNENISVGKNILGDKIPLFAIQDNTADTFMEVIRDLVTEQAETEKFASANKKIPVNENDTNLGQVTSEKDKSTSSKYNHDKKTQVNENDTNLGQVTTENAEILKNRNDKKITDFVTGKFTTESSSTSTSLTEKKEEKEKKTGNRIQKNTSSDSVKEEEDAEILESISIEGELQVQNGRKIPDKEKSSEEKMLELNKNEPIKFCLKKSTSESSCTQMSEVNNVEVKTEEDNKKYNYAGINDTVGNKKEKQGEKVESKPEKKNVSLEKMMTLKEIKSFSRMIRPDKLCHSNISFKCRRSTHVSLQSVRKYMPSNEYFFFIAMDPINVEKGLKPFFNKYNPHKLFHQYFSSFYPNDLENYEYSMKACSNYASCEINEYRSLSAIEKDLHCSIDLPCGGKIFWYRTRPCIYVHLKCRSEVDVEITLSSIEDRIPSLIELAIFPVPLKFRNTAWTNEYSNIICRRYKSKLLRLTKTIAEYRDGDFSNNFAEDEIEIPPHLVGHAEAKFIKMPTRSILGSNLKSKHINVPLNSPVDDIIMNNDANSLFEKSQLNKSNCSAISNFVVDNVMDSKLTQNNNYFSSKSNEPRKEINGLLTLYTGVTDLSEGIESKSKTVKNSYLDEKSSNKSSTPEFKKKFCKIVKTKIKAVQNFGSGFFKGFTIHRASEILKEFEGEDDQRQISNASHFKKKSRLIRKRKAKHSSITF